jgi:hypothetical protein
LETKRQVILLATHIVNEAVLHLYAELKAGLSPADDLYLLIHHEEEWKGILQLPEDVSHYSFNIDSLNALRYTPIKETIVPGSNHFPVLQFYLEHPAYDYYWNIEYDVAFTGRWKKLFTTCLSINTDFMTCHIRYYDEDLLWPWWNSLKTNIPVSRASLLRSFNPIYRISPKALSFLDRFLKEEGNSGHHEVLLPTVLHFSGFKIADFGGNGKFVPEGFHNRFYIDEENNFQEKKNPATMRYRPIFRVPGTEKNKLYHPIKTV